MAELQMRAFASAVMFLTVLAVLLYLSGNAGLNVSPSTPPPPQTTSPSPQSVTVENSTQACLNRLHYGTVPGLCTVSTSATTAGNQGFAIAGQPLFVTLGIAGAFVALGLIAGLFGAGIIAHIVARAGIALAIIYFFNASILAAFSGIPFIILAFFNGLVVTLSILIIYESLGGGSLSE